MNFRAKNWWLIVILRLWIFTPIIVKKITILAQKFRLLKILKKSSAKKNWKRKFWKFLKIEFLDKIWDFFKIVIFFYGRDNKTVTKKKGEKKIWLCSKVFQYTILLFMLQSLLLLVKKKGLKKGQGKIVTKQKIWMTSFFARDFSYHGSVGFCDISIHILDVCWQ